MKNISANFPRFLFVTLIIHGFALFAQNQPPTVNNVHFSQRNDGSYLVDIYYNLNDADGNIMTVSMKVSNDNGSTWTYSCPSITGNKGIGQVSGSNKHIIWDFAADHPNCFETGFEIKVLADDGVYIMNQPCPGLPSYNYGGQTYNTGQIGTQCWMKENLNVGSIINGSSNQTNNGTIERYCYNNDPANCAIYGGLYLWNEMMQYSTTPGIKGICPTDWHIPTDEEWCLLTAYLDQTANCDIYGISSQTDGGKMKETGFTHWDSPNTGASNITGFSGLGGGEYYYNNNYNYLKTTAFFWTSSEYSAENGISRQMYRTNSRVYRMNTMKNLMGHSVRCIKN